MNAELGDIHFELARGGFEKELSHLGAGNPHRHATHLDRLAAGGVPLVGRMRRVSSDQYQSLERYVQLVGGDLGDGGLDALTELDLAAPHRHRTVGVEAHPAIQPRRDFETLRQRHALRG